MTPFTATTHEAATIARAGMGGTVAIVRRLKYQHDQFLRVGGDGRWLFRDAVETSGYVMFSQPAILSPGKPVWVKEGWRTDAALDGFKPGDVSETAPILWGDGDHARSWHFDGVQRGIWGQSRRAITMPRWAARFTLTPETVRVCRVQEVTTHECISAGVSVDMRNVLDYVGQSDLAQRHAYHNAHVDGFRDLWTAQHGPDAWDRNPWVMVALCKIGGVE